ncbi:hypothetical protein PAXRUDRAFT_595178 [Paxillus rubicundulus Ve08.2h10]|uniref:Uncharacterized protein n=1 Tax=Paxillus rubicundulus Ve08.2h10 TaxID=930991 RepID=A0A0D0DTS3_9AGAM|nr:hypothetical protein PAXRUDRAFT_595178 [Paxillus rubicundulus Ve08.2h10]
MGCYILDDRFGLGQLSTVGAQLVAIGRKTETGGTNTCRMMVWTVVPYSICQLDQPHQGVASASRPLKFDLSVQLDYSSDAANHPVSWPTAGLSLRQALTFVLFLRLSHTRM